jgi:hypothetical protein
MGLVVGLEGVGFWCSTLVLCFSGFGLPSGFVVFFSGIVPLFEVVVSGSSCNFHLLYASISRVLSNSL